MKNGVVALRRSRAEWRALAIVLLLVCGFLLFVAYKTSEPVHCDRVEWDKLGQVGSCVVEYR